jgi:hypothetical protein
MRIRFASLALCAGLLLGTGGCNLYYGFLSIFKTRERPVVEGPIPPDFQIGIVVKDLADPPIDYKLAIERSGKGTYEVTVRQPRRRHVEGDFEVSEDQVVGIWEKLVKLKFGSLDDRYPSSGNGNDIAAGTNSVRVFAGGAEMTVETSYQVNETIDAVRAAVIGAFPPETMKALRSMELDGGPKRFVGDTQTKLVHTPDCPALKELPEERRRPLASWYEAMDFRYQPCPDCRPAPPSK